MEKQTWQVWIDNELAVSDYIEGVCYEIVKLGIAQPFEVNEYLESINQDRILWSE